MDSPRTGYQRPIDQPSLGPLGRHGQPDWVAQLGQPADQMLEPDDGVADLEVGELGAGVVQHAHRGP
jgi:hypothetical protein